MSLSPVTVARGRLGRAVRLGTPEEQYAARRELSAANIAVAIDKHHAIAPLTPAQVEALVEKLRAL